jgi:hypothetical protein
MIEEPVDSLVILLVYCRFLFKVNISQLLHFHEKKLIFSKKKENLSLLAFDSERDVVKFEAKRGQI